ncbi:hypothetical protein GCM10027515_28590 [Schumannella luteola]|nr:hypothetical protein FJ656_02760 [Schumannella luteola]
MDDGSLRFAENEPRGARLLALVLWDAGLALIYGAVLGFLASVAFGLIVSEAAPSVPVARFALQVLGGGVVVSVPIFLAGMLLRLVAGPVEAMLLARAEIRRRDARPGLLSPRRERTRLGKSKAFDGLIGFIWLMFGLFALMILVTVIVFLIDPDDDPEVVGVVLLVMIGGAVVTFLGARPFRGEGLRAWRALRARLEPGWTREHLDAVEAAERMARERTVARAATLAGGPQRATRLDSARHRRLGAVLARVNRVGAITFAVAGMLFLAGVYLRQPCRTCSQRAWNAPIESFIDVVVTAAGAIAVVAAAVEAVALVAWLVRRILRRVDLTRVARDATARVRPGELAADLGAFSTSLLLGMGLVAAAAIVAIPSVSALIELDRVGAGAEHVGVARLLLGIALGGAAAGVVGITAGHIAGVRHRNALRRRWSPGDPLPPRPPRRRGGSGGGRSGGGGAGGGRGRRPRNPYAV